MRFFSFFFFTMYIYTKYVLFLGAVCRCQVRRDVLMARAWREGDFARAGELCAGKSERHIVAEQLQAVRPLFVCEQSLCMYFHFVKNITYTRYTLKYFIRIYYCSQSCIRRF